MKRLIKDIHHYTPLISMLLAGIGGFIIFSYDRIFQAVIAIATATAYVVWGFVHHKIHKDLHFSIVLEYLVIAILGLTIILSLVFRA